jgi:hypothetical protein
VETTLASRAVRTLNDGLQITFSVSISMLSLTSTRLFPNFLPVKLNFFLVSRLPGRMCGWWRKPEHYSNGPSVLRRKLIMSQSDLLKRKQLQSTQEMSTTRYFGLRKYFNCAFAANLMTSRYRRAILLLSVTRVEGLR